MVIPSTLASASGSRVPSPAHHRSDGPPNAARSRRAPVASMVCEVHCDHPRAGASQLARQRPCAGGHVDEGLPGRGPAARDATRRQ